MKIIWSYFNSKYLYILRTILDATQLLQSGLWHKTQVVNDYSLHPGYCIKIKLKEKTEYIPHKMMAAINGLLEHDFFDNETL